MYQPNPQVLGTMPQSLSTNVDTRTSIAIFFNIDLDRAHITDSIYVLDPLMNKVPNVGISYENRVVTLTPQPEFLSNTTYKVVIVGGEDANGLASGIRSVLGKPLSVDHSISFTTVQKKILSAPVGIFPMNQSLIREQPDLQWEPVTDAAFYQVKVSTSNSLAPVVWPADSDTDFFPAPSLPGPVLVNPSYQFRDGTYYWAIRAVDSDGVFGEWSPVYVFSIDSKPPAAQAPGDTVPLDAIPYYDAANYPLLEVVESYPYVDESNVPTNLQVIYLKIPGSWDAATFSADLIKIRGRNVDGLTGNPEYPDHGNVGFSLEFIQNSDGTTTLKVVLDRVESQAYLPQL